MHKIREIAIARWFLLVVVLSFGAGFTLALWPQHVITPNIVKIVAPTASIVVLALLYVGTITAWYKLLQHNLSRNWSGEKDGKKAMQASAWLGLLGNLIVAALVFGISFMGTATVFDWRIATQIREQEWLSMLPEGNLLMAGGMLLEGWTYFALFMGLAVFFTWNMMITLYQGLKSWRPTLPERAPQTVQPASRDYGDGSARFRDAGIVPDEDSIVHLEGMLAGSSARG